MPDARKTLEQLSEEWETCEKCELGVRRKETDGNFVFGEGRRRGIMFVGEGPGAIEEEVGRPFAGPSGKLLRDVIGRLGLWDCYFTNCVSCRSCSPAYDGGGQPIMRRDRATKKLLPLINDEPPTPAQVNTCLPRLHEEIYLVDPILIVALGAEAASTLLGRKVSILSERGRTMKITVPGAWSLPVLTEKKKAWRRKVRGEWVMPTVQNQVEYLMLPTVHPAYVLRFHSDRRKGNPLETFAADITLASNIYYRYMTEVHGDSYVERELSPDYLEE